MQVGRSHKHIDLQVLKFERLDIIRPVVSGCSPSIKDRGVEASKACCNREVLDRISAGEKVFFCCRQYNHAGTAFWPESSQSSNKEQLTDRMTSGTAFVLLIDLRRYLGVLARSK